MKTLASVLKETRVQKGMSLRDVQRLSKNNITGTYVNGIENLSVIPSPKKLRVLAVILKLDFMELMVLAGHVERNDLKRGNA